MEKHFVSMDGCIYILAWKNQNRGGWTGLARDLARLDQAQTLFSCSHYKVTSLRPVVPKTPSHRHNPAAPLVYILICDILLRQVDWSDCADTLLLLETLCRACVGGRHTRATEYVDAFSATMQLRPMLRSHG